MFFNLTSVGIDELVGEKHRPYTMAVTNNNSFIRSPRGLRIEDVKFVSVFSGKTLRIIELI